MFEVNHQDQQMAVRTQGSTRPANTCLQHFLLQWPCRPFIPESPAAADEGLEGVEVGSCLGVRGKKGPQA